MSLYLSHMYLNWVEWKFGSLEIWKYANEPYLSHIYLNLVVWKCTVAHKEDLFCVLILPISNSSSQSFKLSIQISSFSSSKFRVYRTQNFKFIKLKIPAFRVAAKEFRDI